MRHPIETGAQVRGAHGRLWGEELEGEVGGVRGQGRDFGGDFLHFRRCLGELESRGGCRCILRLFAERRGCCCCGGEERLEVDFVVGHEMWGSLGELRIFGM